MLSNWTYTHVITLLPTLVVFVVSSIALGLWLKKYDEKIRLIPIHIVTILLVLLEIIKQIKSIILGYTLNKLPLYYCSLFLILYVLTSLYKGKHKNAVRVLTTTTGITLFATMLIMPQTIYSNSAVKNMFNDFDDFHTVVYHNIVLFGTMLMLALDFCKLNIKKDYFFSFIFYISYCFLVAPIANLTGQNYNHFKSNSVAFVENIRLWLIESLGYSFGQSIYVLLATITTVGFSLIMYTVMVVINRCLCRNYNKKVAENCLDNEEEHSLRN